MADFKVSNQIAREERTPLYKARPVSLAEFELCANDILITNRKIHSSVHCAIALAQLGVGEEVLVVEGLCLLEDEFDSFLESMVGMRDYKDDSELIFSLASKGSVGKLLLARDAEQKLADGEKLTRPEEAAYALRTGGWRCGIAKFVTGLVIAAQEVTTTDPRLKELDEDVKRAVKTTGSVVFKEVLQAVASEHEDNPTMQELARRPRDVISAWNEVFERMPNRNIKGHPFLMVNSDVDTTNKALSIFEFLLPKYPELALLMRASLPLINKSIQEKKERRVQMEKNFDSAAQLVGV